MNGWLSISPLQLARHPLHHLARDRANKNDHASLTKLSLRHFVGCTMIQRRTVAAASPSSASAAPSSNSSASRKARRDRGGLSTTAILSLAAVIFLVSLLFPNQVQEAEDLAVQAEQEVVDWWQTHGHLQQKPPVPMEDNTRASSSRTKQANERLANRPSPWVEGEKKLKQKLKELVKLQAEGKFLGVPVLTRYLGEDIPAWPGDGVNVDEWKKQVDAKYEEMRKEEDEWRKKMAALIPDRG